MWPPPLHNHYHRRQEALFHASSYSLAYIANRCASVLYVPNRKKQWLVVAGWHAFADAIFVDDYLVYSANKRDQVQNLFGYVCETPLDVKYELDEMEDRESAAVYANGLRL